ncbi:MAG: recombinase family protein [Firmicutes bacterium]|nr:recombinase family protein [Bacillota bacterium]
MNVVLYFRYSSSSQTEQSIEGQDRVCTEFCQRNDYHILNRYIDRATSAYKDAEKRTNFMQMIRDAEKGKWDAVVVYKLDRFARNRYDSANYKAKLKKAGVKVISATEPISDSPEGIILESVLEGMAEYYSRELAQKISRGMRESALKGNVCGGQTALGYRIENKKWVLDPVEAPIVKEAFELYDAGKSVSQIINIFEEKGYRTSKGVPFNKNSFYHMFKNERYIGTYIYGDIRIENGMPAIVDRDLFERVRDRNARTHKAPGAMKAKVDYLLSGKLFCGHCGANMIGESGKSKTGAVYYYYKCHNAKYNHTCDKKAVRKDWIEDNVAREVFQRITPALIDELAEMAVKASEEDVENNTVIPALRAELQDVERSIKNLFRLVERGSDSEDLFHRLGELDDQKKDIERRLIDAEAEIIILEKKPIVWWFSRFLDGDIENPEFKKRLIDLLVNSVTIYDEPDGTRIDLALNLLSSSTVTIKSSDLDCNAPPTLMNPNFRIYPERRIIVFTIKYPVN